MRILILVYKIIPKGWHIKFYMLNAMYLMLGIFEMLGVASIMPFVALLSDPSTLEKSSIGQLFADFSSTPINQIPVHYIGLVVLTLFVFGNLIGLSSMWLSIRFSAALNVELAGKISAGFFSRGFQFLRSENPTVLANYTVREVERAVTGGVLQLCLVISKIFQATFIIILLAFISPNFTAVFVLVSVVLYSSCFFVLRRKLSTAGEDILTAAGNSVRAASELYESSREVLLRGNFQYFANGIQMWLKRGNKADEIFRVYPMLPKYLIELVAFTLLLSMPIYLSWIGGDYRAMVPIIALFAFAGYRLLPNIQQIYSSLSILKFNTSALEFIYGCIAAASSKKENIVTIPGLQEEIILRGVSYRYPGSSHDAISEVSFSIVRGDKVAIVGLSGSGKSTLLDMLLGLIPLSSGSISVDGVSYSGKSFSWATTAIGYAPQTPLILAGSVAENITFGITPGEIDLNRCREVAKFVFIDDVISELPQGYATKLGVNGSAVSGGESQRIAAARALYHSPSIIFFDEPTSALDPVLSARILENLCSLSFEKTVVAITHDWEALPAFNKIVLLDNGRMLGVGSYPEIAILVDTLSKPAFDISNGSFI